MAKAVLCPVCNGKGVVYGFAPTGAFPTEPCYGCNGKGWVQVDDDPYIKRSSRLDECQK